MQLFLTDVKQLQDSAVVEQLREKVYASLEIYCRTKYPGETGRFAKLLLRLPALRSIALKCIEHLFQHVVGDQPINQFLITRLLWRNWYIYIYCCDVFVSWARLLKRIWKFFLTVCLKPISMKVFFFNCLFKTNFYERFFWS